MTARLMTYPQYRALPPVDVPVRYGIATPDWRLWYVGTEHSCDPAHPELAILRQDWKHFVEATREERPLALSEGGVRPLAGSAEEAVRQFAEPGLLRWLGHLDSIPVRCAEPTYESQIRFALRHYRADDVAHWHLIRHVWSHQSSGSHREIGRYMDDQIDWLRRHLPTDVSLDSIAETHQRITGIGFDPADHDTLYALANPVQNSTVTNRIERRVTGERDRAVVRAVRRYQSQGRSVFIVYGCTHAVMQRPVLESLGASIDDPAALRKTDLIASTALGI